MGLRAIRDLRYRLVWLFSVFSYRVIGLFCHIPGIGLSGLSFVLSVLLYFLCSLLHSLYALFIPNSIRSLFLFKSLTPSPSPKKKKTKNHGARTRSTSGSRLRLSLRLWRGVYWIDPTEHCRMNSVCVYMLLEVWRLGSVHNRQL